MEMDHYEVVPPVLAEKVLANVKRPNQDEFGRIGCKRRYWEKGKSILPGGFCFIF